MSTVAVSPTRSMARPLRILIVDDSEIDVDWISRLLRQQYGNRIEITDCDTGAAAMQQLERRTFDVALIDYRLPDLTGLRLLEAVTDLANDMAVIVLTGQGNESIAAQAIKSGAADYLVKRDITGESLAGVLSQAQQSVERGRSDRRLVRHLTHAKSEVDHYMRSLSHDMSANLMVLEHSFERLKHHFPHRDQFEGVSHVEACLKESKRYLDDLSLLATTGSVSVEPERVELEALVDDVLLELHPLIEMRQIVASVQGPLPVIWCNAARVRQVISNLLRNCIRHGCDPAMPRIVISSPATTDRHPPLGYCWLRIYDNGAGIPPEFQQEVFLPGRRMPGATAPGTGMGLAIVKQIVDQCGGSVGIESDGRRGTAFWIALPSSPAKN
jgi:signal transduction histidine kinase